MFEAIIAITFNGMAVLISLPEEFEVQMDEGCFCADNNFYFKKVLSAGMYRCQVAPAYLTEEIRYDVVSTEKIEIV